MYTIPLPNNAQSASGFEVDGTGRNVVTWRTPAYGYVVMYIAPQQITISDSKILTSTRTKAGFVMQYAGEDLTQLSINGTTGSAGIEGINILDAVYRSEQAGFKNIAKELDAAVSLRQFGGNFDNLVAGAANSLSPELGAIVGLNLRQNQAMNVFARPTPTLAALASAVELSYQGVTYRGYFTGFSNTESASEPGLFNYDIKFVAYAKFGSRQNFMPWHRRADTLSDSGNLDLLTFGNVKGSVSAPPVETTSQSSSQVGTLGNNDGDLLSGRDQMAFSNVNLNDED